MEVEVLEWFGKFYIRRNPPFEVPEYLHKDGTWSSDENLPNGYWDSKVEAMGFAIDQGYTINKD